MSNRDETLQKFGERVRAKREADGLTQEELADMIGVKAGQISKIEHARSGTSADTRRALRRWLDGDVSPPTDPIAALSARVEEIARAVLPRTPTRPTCAWPLRGRVAAGGPIMAVQQAEERDGPADLARGDRYLLEVRGDSMQGCGVRDGALVAVEDARGWRFKRGDCVIAYLRDDDAATLKRYVRSESYRTDEGEKRRRVILAPVNPDYDTQVYDGEQIEIQGKAIAVRNRDEDWRNL